MAAAVPSDFYSREDLQKALAQAVATGTDFTEQLPDLVIKNSKGEEVTLYPKDVSVDGKISSGKNYPFTVEDVNSAQVIEVDYDCHDIGNVGIQLYKNGSNWVGAWLNNQGVPGLAPLTRAIHEKGVVGMLRETIEDSNKTSQNLKKAMDIGALTPSSALPSFPEGVKLTSELAANSGTSTISSKRALS